MKDEGSLWLVPKNRSAHQYRDVIGNKQRLGTWTFLPACFRSQIHLPPPKAENHTHCGVGQAWALAQASKEQREGVFRERMVRLGQEEEGSPNTLYCGGCALAAVLIQVETELLPPPSRKWEVPFPGPVPPQCAASPLGDPPPPDAAHTAH